MRCEWGLIVAVAVLVGLVATLAVDGFDKSRRLAEMRRDLEETRLNIWYVRDMLAEIERRREAQP